MRRVIPLTVFRKITFVRPGSIFTPRCSARWNRAIRMETCWSVCARTLTFGLFRCAAKQTCMRAISLQRHFVNIGGRIAPSMREGFFIGGNGQVVQRGFEKFFAVDETEETSFAQVVNHAQEHPESLPVRVERKENGFLGLVGAAGTPGLFRFWSKSGQTDYSALIERPFPSDSAVRAELWRMLHEWNVTAAFEVIDRESDRHIVGYESSGLRLLHLIRNAESFSIDAAHEETFTLAGGFVRPETVAICHSPEEVAQAIGDAKASPREGVVLYFADGWMVKVKSDRYKLVKAMRPLMQRVLLRGRSFNKSGDIADLARRIIDYAHEHHIDLAYERQAFGERDIDMTKVNDIVDHVR